MKLFANSTAVRGSVAWTNPLRLAVTLFPHSEVGESEPEIAPASDEYDEEGRRYVFRFARTRSGPCTIERDRIFEYMKRHRLPDETDRQIRRDLRNRADLFADIRDLQTHPDIAGA